MTKNDRNPSGSLSRRELRRTERAARRRYRRVTTVAWIGGATALMALVAFLAVSNAANRPGEAVPDMGNVHIKDGVRSPVAYNSTPPTSGPHYGGLARWGIHTELIPDEQQVHNLEDGGVGVWYDCPDGCPELVSQLESVVGRYHDRVLMAPYPQMDSRLALTAWNRIDQFDEFDQERIVRFIRAFRGTDHHASR